MKPLAVLGMPMFKGGCIDADEMEPMALLIVLQHKGNDAEGCRTGFGKLHAVGKEYSSIQTLVKRLSALPRWSFCVESPVLLRQFALNLIK